MECYLKRQVCDQMLEWKQQPEHSTSDVSGAHQMKYTEQITIFAGKDVL